MMNTQINQSQTPDIADYSRLTILVVDDEEYNLMLLEAYLNDSGADIIFARNGFEAVEKCEIYSNIHLVLMDIRMPVMNGIAATKKIKSFRNMPVIAVSAFPYHLEEGKISGVGFDDYLEKPFSQHNAFELINKHLNIVKQE
jgi:CheY-like chemotaxis protein